MKIQNLSLLSVNGTPELYDLIYVHAWYQSLPLVNFNTSSVIKHNLKDDPSKILLDWYNTSTSTRN